MFRTTERRSSPAIAHPIVAGSRCRRRAATVLTCLLLGQAAAQALGDTPEATATGQLKQLSVEDLMNVEVTSVAKEPQKLLQAAAAIQVITAEDIRRSGATSIPEALRLADNLRGRADQLARLGDQRPRLQCQSRQQAAGPDRRPGRVHAALRRGALERAGLSAGGHRPHRGHQRAGRHAVGRQRGQRRHQHHHQERAADTQGLYADAGGGNELREQAGARYGTSWRPTSTCASTASTPTTAMRSRATGANAQDAWHMARGGFRMDAQASAQRPAHPAGRSLQRHRAGRGRRRRGGHVGRQRARPLDAHAVASGTSMSLQLYYDHTYLSQPFAASPACAALLQRLSGGVAHGQPRHLRCGFPVRLRLGCAAKLTWGLGYRADTHEADFDLSVVRFSPPVLDQASTADFCRTRSCSRRDVYLTVGSKLEHNDYTGYEVEPSARLQWNRRLRGSCCGRPYRARCARPRATTTI